MKFNVEIELFGRGVVKGDKPETCTHVREEDGTPTCDCPETMGEREPLEDAVVQAIAARIMDQREYALNEHFSGLRGERNRERLTAEPVFAGRSR